MFTEDDTLNAERNANSQNENENQNERKMGQTLKTAALFVAGGVAGAAASYATNAIVNNPTQEDETPVNEAVGQNDQQASATTPATPSQEENATPQTEDSRTDNHVDKPAPTHSPTPTPTPEPTPAPTPEPTPAPTPEPTPTPGLTPAVDQKPTPNEFFEKNDVEVDHIVTKDVFGSSVHVASGKVNGHDAMFIDDGHGNIEKAYVDKNDDHIPDDDEIYDAKSLNIKMSHLAEHMEGMDDNRVAAVPINNDTEDEVKVIAVVEDVDMGGISVNVAAVTINGEDAMYVDVTKNGVVDAMMKDDNKDGQISENEVRDVRDQHIPMPKADEAEYASDELPDYSSDDDITLFDA